MKATWTKGQDPKQEIVAEFCAAVLTELYCPEQVTHGNHYEYIMGYAKEMDKDPTRAVLSVLGDVEKCLAMIFTQEQVAKTLAA